MKRTSTLLYLLQQIDTEPQLQQTVNKIAGKIEFDSEDDLEIYEPPQGVVNAILNYARSLEIKDSETMGQIEYVLN